MNANYENEIIGSRENSLPLRNGIILDILNDQKEILKKIEKMFAHLREIQKEMKRHSEQIEQHLKDHSENIDTMGFGKFIEKYGKKHWKFLIGSFLFTQVAIAFFISLLMIKFGIEKVIGFFLR
jgi:hypothetical protein